MSLGTETPIARRVWMEPLRVLGKLRWQFYFGGHGSAKLFFAAEQIVGRLHGLAAGLAAGSYKLEGASRALCAQCGSLSRSVAACGSSGRVVEAVPLWRDECRDTHKENQAKMAKIAKTGDRKKVMDTTKSTDCPKCGKPTRIVKRVKDRERGVPGGVYISCSVCEFYEKL